MDFAYSDRQEQLRNAARKFAQAELREVAKELEGSHEPVSPELRRRFAELGYLGLNLPSDGFRKLMEAFDLERCGNATMSLANEITREVTGAAIQIMGAYGYSTEFPVERSFRDAWGWGIAGGSIDIQKINIASTLVGRRFDQRR
jgi:alkylation response protein AidB-like acyl-CoA dehydrogenase